MLQQSYHKNLQYQMQMTIMISWKSIAKDSNLPVPTLLILLTFYITTLYCFLCASTSTRNDSVFQIEIDLIDVCCCCCCFCCYRILSSSIFLCRISARANQNSCNAIVYFQFTRKSWSCICTMLRLCFTVRQWLEL